MSRKRFGIFLTGTSFYLFGYIGCVLYIYFSEYVRHSKIPNRQVPSEFGYDDRHSKHNGTQVGMNASKMKTHIIFLKVHKAGSSTMQNIFFRFGLKYSLNILVPNRGNYLHSRDQIIPLKQNEHFDIFACHTLRMDIVKNLLPADTVKIGIVREPVSRMISAAYFYRDMAKFKYLMRVPYPKFINNLVNYPDEYDPKQFSFTRNSMARDFGFPFYQASDRDKIRKYLGNLNSEFLLVLVLEKFNESLVLKKRILNWKLTDIVYLTKNTHKHEPISLNETEITKLKLTNHLDFEIYEYFLEVLELKIQQASEDFTDEVSYFKTVLEKVHYFCNNYHTTRRKLLVIEGFNTDDNITISVDDCLLMQSTELSFISSLRKDLLNETEMISKPKNKIIHLTEATT